MIFRAFFSGLDLKVHTHCMATSAKRETFFFPRLKFFWPARDTYIYCTLWKIAQKVGIIESRAASAAKMCGCTLQR